MIVRVDGATLHVEVDGEEGNPALLVWPPGTCAVTFLESYVSLDREST